MENFTIQGKAICPGSVRRSNDVQQSEPVPLNKLQNDTSADAGVQLAKLFDAERLAVLEDALQDLLSLVKALKETSRG